jgi:integrase
MARKGRKRAARHLVLKGRKYWFTRDIPEAIRSHFGGKTAYLVNLETGDVTKAMGRRDEILAETNKLFRAAKEGRPIKGATDAILDLANAWVNELQTSRADPHAWTATIFNRDPAHVADEDVMTADDFTEERADAVGREHGDQAQVRFMNIVSGRVDVDHHLDAYMREVRLAENTKRERKSLILRFSNWAKVKGWSLPQIDRAKAGRYFSEAIVPLNERTARKHHGSVKLYWDYLIARGHVSGTNPWEGQRMPDRSRRVERGGKAEERPFNEEEIKTLLYSAYPRGMREAFKAQIHDAIRLAALSGLRLAELVTLWVEECPIDEDGNGHFDIRQGKTSAAARRVPMHPDVIEIVKRRKKGKDPQDWLFHELADERNAGDVFGKRFANYREKLGVDDKRPGQRRSLVNFHSFRRWFVTEAERAGIPESTISSVVGHEEGRKSITLGVYSGGPAWQQMRACVEAVKLPRPHKHDALLTKQTK